MKIGMEENGVKLSRKPKSIKSRREEDKNNRRSCL